MDILYIGAFRLPKYDAAAARVLTIGKALKESGHHISYLSWGGKYIESNISTDGKYKIDGMPYHITNEMDGRTISEKLFLKLRRGFRTLEYIKSLDRKPDLIITYNTPYKFNRKILNFCKENKIKLVSDITEWYDNNELNLWDSIPNWLNMTKMYRRFPNIISISSYLANFYSNDHTIIVPALADYKEEKWYRKGNLKLDSFNGITLIYAGTPAKKDKLHIAVAATQMLINEGAKIRFIIAGCEREKYMKAFSGLYPNLMLSSNIIFLGRVDQDMIPALYEQADFMVLLREKNRKSEAGFPTKFTESMMSGTPVICNLTSDLGKYITDGYNGFVLKDDSLEACIEVLRKKVLNLSTEEIQEMKCNAKKTGIGRLDYRNYTEKLNHFINNLA